jgi:cysteine desulfurase / selenocysteine lyase
MSIEYYKYTMHILVPMVQAGTILAPRRRLWDGNSVARHECLAIQMNPRIHYLDHASMGRPARRTIQRVRESVAALASFRSGGTSETLRQLDAVEKARIRIARAIHADPASILFIGNTTQALGTIATALPLRPGDNILVADVEFMGATIVWQGVCRRLGVNLISVPTHNGTVRADDFAAVANQRTRAIVVSAVQEVSGFRADISSIREIAARSNAYLIVDGIQEIGARPVNFQKLGVDAYCAGGHKWLRSPFGLGFMCLAPRLIDALDPSYQGYLALSEPEIGWGPYMELPHRTPFDLPPQRRDAGRLETGGYPNWLGAIALDAAFEEWQSFGEARAWATILKLRTRLANGLTELGLKILATQDAAESSFAGIVTFCLPGGVEAERQLLAQLTRSRTYAAIRYVSGIGGIRSAVHFTNTPADVDALLHITQRFLKRTQRSRATSHST